MRGKGSMLYKGYTKGIMDWLKVLKANYGDTFANWAVVSFSHMQ